MAVMPATLAILSIAFVETIFSVFGVTDEARTIKHKLLSVLVLVVINGANSISTKASTRLNNFFVGTKFVTIFGVVVAGIVVVILGASDPNRDVGGRDWRTKPWFGFRDTVNPDGSTIDWSKLSEWQILGHYSAALYGALWAYSGWDKVSCGRSLLMNEICSSHLAGHLHLGRTFGTCSPTPTCYQYCDSYNHSLLHYGEYCLLYPTPMERDLYIR